MAEPGTGRCTLRCYAGARAAAGVAELDVVLTVATVGGVLTAAVRSQGPALAAVLPRCSLLLDGRSVTDRSTPVADGQTLDVLPPFAGG